MVKKGLLREAFKKNNNETYEKFHILGGGWGQQGVIFHMLSRKILNAQKAILSIFRHLFFPLKRPKILRKFSLFSSEDGSRGGGRYIREKNNSV